MVLRVGLTGGLATGKSSVAEMLTARGAHLIRADLLVHELMRPGAPLYDEVLKHFGRNIVKQDGSDEIDRARLANAAFGAGRIEDLNRITHPAVIRKQEEWMAEIAAKDPDGIAVVEAALIVEAGVAKRFDRLVVVTSTPDRKVERFAARTTPNESSQAADTAAVKEAEAEARRRIAAQMPDEEKVKFADYVIQNNGSLEELEREVEKVFQALTEDARTKPNSRPLTGQHQRRPPAIKK